MTLSDFSIKNPVFAWMLMAALILFGAISFGQMGVSQMPDVDFPVVSVSLTWEGAAPEVMETDVVDVVEDAMMGLQGIRDLSSATRQGQATVTIEFDLERDIDVAFQDVQAKLAQAQRQLPQDLDPPIVSKVNPQDQPVMWIGVAGEMPLRDLTAYVQDVLKDRFQTIQGVGEVMLGGFRERTRWAWVDADKLAQYQLTVTDVVEAIEREHREQPAGRIETGAQEFNVRAFGEANTPEQFGDLVIAHRGGQPVYRPIYLKDVAQIEDGMAEQRRVARVMGKPAVGLGIKKQRGANEVEVAHRVLERLKEVQRDLPPGIDAGVNFNRTQFIEDSIHELTFTLLLSALLTSLVCWLFLGSWSATVNILMAIPTAIVGTFIALKFLGFTLNTFTLLGLSLAIGIVVDDAIMVLENIVRHRELGTEKVEAARRGARQITGAALAATLAIIAIFLPVAFMAGLIGRFFFEFGMTISIAVALSLLEALTLAPMRCSQFLRVEPRHTRAGRAIETGFQRLAEGYRKTLLHVLRHRGLVLVATLLVFAGSLLLLGQLRKEFVPSQDQSMFLCRLQTPVGSSMAFTDSRFKQAEQYVMTRPELKRYFGAIGGFGGGEVNTGILFVTFKPLRERPIVPPNTRPLSQQELMTVFRTELNKIPDAKVSIQDLSLNQLSAQRGFPIELTVRGPDWERLIEASNILEQRMAASPLLVDVDTDYLASVPEVRVRPNREQAAARGVSTETVAETINALIGGTRVAKYTDSGRRYDVRVRLVPSQRTQAEDIERLWVWNNRGELVQLKDVATISQEPALTTITRRGRERAIGLFANVAPGQSQQTALEEVQRLGREVLPEGYRLVLSGSAQTFQESFQSLLFALWLGIIVAYMVLGSQYNSYLHPVTVLLALPFSISGALVALWLGNQSLNVYSFIGLILLMGIVKKNSILLVDFANQAREQGAVVQDALMQACPARLRPILMTSISTIAAAVPPALAMGP
ncbi:MAG: hypothetical protein A3C53_05990, partial [Omnitrophica WOR_2 bacterium RIFCSPHIGHO2_02_FULL_68_15]